MGGSNGTNVRGNLVPGFCLKQGATSLVFIRGSERNGSGGEDADPDLKRL